MKSVVITGVSTGIGFAAAAELLNKGYKVFGSVRSESDANRLQRLWGPEFVPLIFDISNDAAVRQAAGLVKDALKGATLTALINNAGIAHSGPIQFFSLDNMREQLEINVIGLLRTTQLFLPLLGGIKEKVETPGKVINISSVSGIITTPFMGPYCASKFAVESLSDAMRREFSVYGIKVVVVQPGPIKTEIWRKAKEQVDEYPDNIFSPLLANRSAIVDKRSKNALPVEKVATLLREIIENKKPQDRYLITPNKPMVQLARRLPVWLQDKLLIKMLLKDNGMSDTK
ncbi:MAG: SDR family oxidoreductase [Saprospiraceae bacterium]|nr:SDR family oxidoreductase [Saprospiraceae bacterium]